jgi:DNA-directed RNA polymerase specialized sigma24 family protein
MGYSVDEIASILKTKPSTVKSQLHRARQKLKLDLEGVEINV